MYSRNTLKIASSFLSPFLSIKTSASALKSISCFATIVLSTVIGLAQLAVEPTARNSNLLPVKANGEVRFLSVLSKSISGILPTTLSFKSVFSFGDNFPFVTPSNSPNTFVSCAPINTDIIAGGASLAPNLWSLLAEAIEARNSSSLSHTALIVLMKNVKNCKLLIGVLPGAKRFMPVSVLKLQLLCFPEPLTPAKGFS